MIQLLEEKDLDKVMEIWLKTNLSAHSFIQESYWREHYNIVKQYLPLAVVYVEKEKDVIKGFIGITENHYIAGLFVSNEFQNSGVGKKLLCYCKEKYSKLTLDVYAENKKAIQFYLSQGFIIQTGKEQTNTQAKEYAMIWTR